ncbi:unnamed protein product [Protopolystoma xenopodis]|uniref:Uncharacterized protein n=1 Tax=Protopolystoma xenopodis TaxID=117903 RepID=A0A3S5CKY7_9PLAT|nr:unnamed protein product [Protopolystoma xenopodis]
MIVGKFFFYQSCITSNEIGSIQLLQGGLLVSSQIHHRIAFMFILFSSDQRQLSSTRRPRPAPGLDSASSTHSSPRANSHRSRSVDCLPQEHSNSPDKPSLGFATGTPFLTYRSLGLSPAANCAPALLSCRAAQQQIVQEKLAFEESHVS